MRTPTLAHGSRCAVHGYARLNPWLDLRDLEQEAAVTAIKAGRTWRPDGGTSRKAWEAWKVGLVLSRFAAQARTPVSLPGTKGKKGSAERRHWDEAASAQREPLSVPTAYQGDVDTRDVASVSAALYEPIEERLDRARALAAAVALLDARHSAAKAVVIDGEKPADVAARMGITRAEVYDHTARALRALRAALHGPEE